MTWLLGIHPAHFLTGRALFFDLQDKDKEHSDQPVMSPNPTTFLGLVFCLGRAIHTQEVFIQSQPMFVTLRGRPAVAVCRGPGTKLFALVRKDGRYAYRKPRPVCRRGSRGTEARLCTPAVSEDTARHYICLHRKGSSWGVFRKPLKLKMTVKDVSTLSSGTTLEIMPPPTEVPLVPTEGASPTASASRNYTVGNCVCISLAGVVLLILVVILAEAGHSQHGWSHRPQGWTQESSHRRDCIPGPQETPPLGLEGSHWSLGDLEPSPLCLKRMVTAMTPV